MTATAAARADYFTELFDASDNDLDYQRFTFTPDGSTNFYSVCRDTVTSLAANPNGGTTLALTDDSSAQVTLSGGAQVSLYGNSNSTFFVGSNGYITFGTGDSTYDESLTAHFAVPRIAALFDDLLPSGHVSWRQLPDRVAVTWLNIPEFGISDQNTFQIELFFDGRIRITYLAVVATDGLAGLSAGTGVPGNFTESDLSTYGFCAPPSPSLPAAPTNLTAAAASSAQINLSWSDNADNEDGFKIERAPDVTGSPGTWAQIATVSTNITTYSDTGLASESTYWYRVRSYNGLGNSPYGNEASATVSSNTVEVILDDTWADGTRNNQNPPTDSAWFTSSTGSGF